MAKAHKMNRGARRLLPGEKVNEGPQLPVCVHFVDSHGNAFASIPELSKLIGQSSISPRYFTLKELNYAAATNLVDYFTDKDMMVVKLKMEEAAAAVR